MILDENLALGICHDWLDAQNIFLLDCAHLRVCESAACLWDHLDVLFVDMESCGVASLLGALRVRLVLSGVQIQTMLHLVVSFNRVDQVVAGCGHRVIR